MVEVNTTGKMVVDILVNGRKVWCMVKEHAYMKMEEFIRANTRMTPSMARVPSPGQMERYTTEAGTMASSMAEQSSPMKRANPGWLSGSMESASNGCKKRPRRKVQANQDTMLMYQQIRSLPTSSKPSQQWVGQTPSLGRQEGTQFQSIKEDQALSG